MWIKKWPLVAAIFLSVTLLLGACGEEIGNDEEPGTLPAARLNLAECGKAAANLPVPTGAAATPAPTLVSSTGARVELPPGTKLYVSNTFPEAPYALALPTNWESRENQVQNNIKGDLFIIKKGAKSGAFVTIVSEKLNNNEDSKAFFDAKFKEATAISKGSASKIEYEQQPERPVGGVSGYVLAYNTPQSAPFAYPVQSVQVLFAAQGRGWSLNFAASPIQAAQYCPYFARLVDSWTLSK